MRLASKWSSWESSIPPSLESSKLGNGFSRCPSKAEYRRFRRLVHCGWYVPRTVRFAFWATKSPEVELAPRGFLWRTQSSTDRKIELPLALVQLLNEKIVPHFLCQAFRQTILWVVLLTPCPHRCHPPMTSRTCWTSNRKWLAIWCQRLLLWRRLALSFWCVAYFI
jgi:hypothetical protein